VQALVDRAVVVIAMVVPTLLIQLLPKRAHWIALSLVEKNHAMVRHVRVIRVKSTRLFCDRRARHGFAGGLNQFGFAAVVTVQAPLFEQGQREFERVEIKLVQAAHIKRLFVFQGQDQGAERFCFGATDLVLDDSSNLFNGNHGELLKNQQQCIDNFLSVFMTRA
jgi:hypothetical protein